MMAEYDEKVLYYQRINYGNYIVKMKDDDGLEDRAKNSTLCHYRWAFLY